jgi:hypothetical protein
VPESMPMRSERISRKMCGEDGEGRGRSASLWLQDRPGQCFQPDFWILSDYLSITR